MEKTLNLVHNEFKMVEPVIERKSLPDYDLSVFEVSIKNTSEYAEVFKRKSFDKYRKLKFPVWKRAKLDGFKLPEYPEMTELEINGPKIWKPFNLMGAEDYELLEKLEFQGSDEKFVLLSDTFSSSGVIVRTEPGKYYETPLEVKRYGKASIASSLFYVSRGSFLTLIINNSEEAEFVSEASRFYIEDNANLNILFLQNDSLRGYNFSNNFYILGENAKLRIYDVLLDGNVSAPYHLVKVIGKRTEVNILSAFFASGGMVIDALYTTRLVAPESTAKIKGIGAVAGGSKVVFRGTVDIKKGAKNSSGDEHSDVIILSKEAIVQAIPSLLVDENEVNASHAASVGTIDAEKMYYLMSRGLPEEEALKLIVMGSFNPVLEKIADEFGKDYARRVYDVIQERIE
ncbi:MULTISPECIES: SufD family Fe-S cluster assembly protein [Kosmotoga]|uniref:SufBD protein n=1 Tax=Kosmotoga olearia (strain ATCC BAA-1733 / DSM 21960 / TBF 19.5.1) TaxID=521045 RepID=C5CED9_KOSOT|nr:MULTISPECIES: SufD family Fe-S cluster assembly protein [Kosmotoga]ACR80179.1 SufBD protein [Kosmotoga olearia TBF 19.5.1]MDI3523821.1 hypothetical protein [Kosmotoga sp.]MDK2953845.1 hypothetical protein [Kosmotoga sp.]OAA20365.1 hypothetical protein DU53_08215 [Kosmotoga sp. DU53]